VFPCYASAYGGTPLLLSVDATTVCAEAASSKPSAGFHPPTALTALGLGVRVFDAERVWLSAYQYDEEGWYRPRAFATP
jgi:hypothetical protein